MKRSFRCLALPALAGLLLVSACTDCIRGTGERVTAEKEPGSVSGIRLGVPARLVIEQGLSPKLQIEAQQNILDNIRLETARENLVITSAKCMRDFEEITIYIMLPEVKRMIVDGSGDIEARGTVHTGHLEIAINGSGSVRADVTCESLYTGIKGSGEIELSGSSQKVFSRVDGSGNFKAAGLASVRNDIRINGSGNASVFVIESLSAEVNGSGDIRYKGDPAISTRIRGSGQISKVE